MLEEAATLGAHGIIGVVDRVAARWPTPGRPSSISSARPSPWPTGPAPAGGVPWTTYLAGQRLTKSIESGFMPVAVVAALASVQVWAYCMTDYLIRGSMGWGTPSGPTVVEQIGKAHMAARQLARKHVRRQSAGDELHGASIDIVTRELGEGDQVIDCTLRGNRVRRFKDFDPVALPRPTVRLA